MSSPEHFLSGRHLAAGLTVNKVKAGLSLILGCGWLSRKGQRLMGESMFQGPGMTSPALLDSEFQGSACLQSGPVCGGLLVVGTHFVEDTETQGNKNKYLGGMWQNKT